MRRKLVKGISIIFIICFCMVGWSFFVAAIAEKQDGYNEHDLIRLHVLANSDSPADQRLKLLVRDAVVNYLAPKLEGVNDKSQVRQIIAENKIELISLSSRILLAQGAYYPVDIEIGVFDFPVKSYGDIVLPAGKYEAVRVLIGDAEGANWWCVLFPPLCFIDESKVVYTTEDNEIKEDINHTEAQLEFRFKIAELMKDI